MSWMDSWSRPSKSQATPAPFYLLSGGDSTPYCHSCGRVIGSRRTTGASQATPVKYCSSRCRSHKPGKLDREIERAFVRVLAGQDTEPRGTAHAATNEDNARMNKKSATKAKKHKGDPRVLVTCNTVEKLVFGDREQVSDNQDSHSEDGNGSGDAQQDQLHHSPPYDIDVSTGSLEDPIKGDTAYLDGHVLARMAVRSGTRVRPAQSISEVNGSVGGEKGRAERIGETEEMLEKRKMGQRRAKEREMVRCAARRGVAFGFVVDSDDPSGLNERHKRENERVANIVERKKCEAVMLGKVVEPSFAKGDWGIRWRE
ncbi:Fc.00g072350.m01.CDS01 [Cosmosporella sp. VM-42]